MNFCFVILVFFSFLISSVSQFTHADDYLLDFSIHQPQSAKKTNNNNINTNGNNTGWQLGLQALLNPDWLRVSGEIRYDNSSQGSVTKLSDRDKYLLDLRISGGKESFTYGFNHYSLGKYYNGKYTTDEFRTKDHAENEAWLSYKFDDLTLTAKYSHAWTNLSGNDNQPISLENWYKVESNYTFSSYPYSALSMSYNLGKRQQTSAASQAPGYKDTLTSIKTKFQFAHKLLSFSIGASQFDDKNRHHDNQAYRVQKFYISGNLFPRYALSVIPSFRISQNTRTNSAFDQETTKTETSLGFSFKPQHSNYRISLTTAYENNFAEHQSLDKDIYKIGAELNWKTKINTTGSTANWTINYQFKETRNFTTPEVDNTDRSILLRCRLPLG